MTAQETSSPRHLGAATRGGTVVLLMVLLSALAALGYLSLIARDEIESLATANSDNSQWSLAQTEVDAANLATVLSTLPSVPSALPAIRQRFDIFYSRISILTRSPVFAIVRDDPDLAANLRRIQDWLDATIPLIDGPDQSLTTALPDIASEFGSLRQTIRAVSTAGVRVFAQDAQAKREMVMTTLAQLAFLTAGVLVLLAIMVILMMRQLNLRRAQNQQQRMISDRLAAMIDTSLDAIVVADEAGKFVDFNGAAQAVFGYERADIIGASMSETIVPPALRAAHAHGMERYRMGEDARVVGKGRVQLQAMRKTGEVFPAEVSISAVQQGGSKLFVSYIRDISAQVAAEASLVEARDQALAGERAKAELLAVMSHEMRTPLNGVLGTLELLEDTELSAAQRDLLRILRTSGQLLLAQVNDVLDISRHDARSLDLVDEPLDAVTIANEVAAALSPVATERGNTISVTSLSGPSLNIMGDARRLQQVLMNIIGNAVKFTQNGQISVEVEQLEDQGNWLELRVADEGIGIAQKDFERIFEDFVTLDAGYSRQAEGTGLGLGITQRLVIAMGGTMGVESEPGAGSLFWVRVPFRLVDQQPQPTAAVTQETASAAQALSVLLIEDNQINRLIIGEMLRGMGHTVQEAFDGQTGVALSEQTRFDVILTDISMPGMDGLAVARAIIGGTGASQSTPILAVTAHALPDDVARFRDAGMSDVLTKPITRAQLSAAFGKLTPHSLADVVVADSAAPPNLSHDRSPDATPEASVAFLDEEVINDARQSFGDALFTKTMARFLSETDAELSALDDVLQSDTVTDWSDFAGRVHNISGAAAMLGARGLHEVLKSLETAAKEKDAGKVALIWPSARAAFHATRQALLGDQSS